MKSYWTKWPYWVRGVIIGLVGYVAVTAAFLFLVYSDSVTCSLFYVYDLDKYSQLNDSVFCPIIYYTLTPAIVVGELVEDISSGVVTHWDWYLVLLAGSIVYLSLFAYIGFAYGKRSRKLSANNTKL